MAEEFQIKVVTTADTSGLAQSREEMKRLREEAEKSRQDVGAKALFEKIPPSGDGPGPEKAQELAIEEEIATIATRRFQLSAAQVAGDEARISVLRQEIAVRSATLAIMRSQALTQAEINALQKTQGVVLGNITAQTGAAKGSMVSFASAMATAAVISTGINRTISQLAEQQNKVSQELDAQGAKVVDLGKKWREAARGALTPGDVAGIAESGVGEIDKIGARIRELATTDLTQTQKAMDAIWGQIQHAATAGMAPATGPNKALQDELLIGLGQTQQLLREQARRAIEAGEANTKAFDARKVQPLSQAVGELINKIEEHRALQQKVGAENVESYLAEAKIIKDTEAQLAALIAVEESRASFRKTDLEDEKSETEKVNEALRETEKLLRAIGVTAGTPAEAFQKGIGTAGALGVEIRKLATDWANLQSKQRETLSGDLFKGPVDAAKAAADRQRQHAAEVASTRELAAEGQGKEVSAGAEKKFQLEEQLRLLQRQQALQRSLLPEGAGPAEQLKALGTQGLKDFEARAERIQAILKELGGKPAAPAQLPPPAAPPAAPVPPVAPPAPAAPPAAAPAPAVPAAPVPPPPAPSAPDLGLREAMKENTGWLQKLYQLWQ